MRIGTAFFALAAWTLASSPTTYAHGGGSTPHMRGAGLDDKDYGHSSKQHDGGSSRDSRDSSDDHRKHHKHHNKHDKHHNKHDKHEHKGSSRDGHKSRHGGGGSHHHGRHGGKASGAKVTGRSGDSRVNPNGRMRVRCSPPDKGGKGSRFVVDLVECFNECCQDEDHCGQFIVNLGNEVPCLTEDAEEKDGDWDCDFQLTLPAEALAEAQALNATDDGHGYRIRITDSNDDTYQSCSPPIDIAPAASTTPSPTTSAPTIPAPITPAPTTPAPTTPEGGQQQEEEQQEAEPEAEADPCIAADDDGYEDDDPFNLKCPPYTVTWTGNFANTLAEIDLFYCGIDCSNSQEDECGDWVAALCPYECGCPDNEGDYGIVMPQPLESPASGGTFKVRVRDANDESNWSCSGGFDILSAEEVVVDGDVDWTPGVTFNSPKDGDLAYAGETFTLKIDDYFDNVGSRVGRFNIDLYESGGGDGCEGANYAISTCDKPSVGCKDSKGDYDVGIPKDVPEGNYNIRVSPFADNSTYDCSGEFTVVPGRDDENDASLDLDFDDDDDDDVAFDQDFGPH